MTSIHTPRGPIPEARTPHSDTRRGLASRHIQMMAIGGTIGVGLFLGSGEGIAVAGPSLILAYAAAGLVVIFLMRALGEISVHWPANGAFSAFPRRYLGPFAGFVTGWTYWLQCAVVAMAELTACGLYMHYWFPGLPQWVTAVVGLAALFALHLLSVSSFGEAEFWFAILKVVAIMGLIVLGVVILVTGVTMLGDVASVTNLWHEGGFFPHGFTGFASALRIAVFAFVGVEMLAMTIGEVKDPARSIPRAVNGVIWRVTLFYVGALLILMVVQPWTNYAANTSPFVAVMTKAGIAGSAGVVTFVVLASALSSCNQQIYNDTRILHGMAASYDAPQALSITNSKFVPVRSLIATSTTIAIGIVLNVVDPDHAFTYLTSIVTVSGLWMWAVVMLCHWRYRREVAAGREEEASFQMKGAPWINVFVLVVVAALAASLVSSSESRLGLYVAVVWLAVLTVVYRVRESRRKGVRR